MDSQQLNSTLQKRGIVVPSSFKPSAAEIAIIEKILAQDVDIAETLETIAGMQNLKSTPSITITLLNKAKILRG